MLYFRGMADFLKTPLDTMPTPLSVLILADQPSAALLVETLRQFGFEPVSQRVDTEADYSAHLGDPVDIILADYAGPQLGGLQALDLLKTRHLDIPLIIVAEALDDEMAVECVKRGAAGHLMKGRLNQLGETVAHALEQKRFRGEMQKTLAALQTSEKKYRQLVNTMQEGMWVVDLDGRTTFVNRRMAEMVGYTPEVLMGRTLFEFIDRNWEEQLDVKFLRKDGRHFYASLATSPIIDEAGHNQGTLIGVVDITDRKRGEAIRAATYKIAQATNTAPTLDELYAAIHAILNDLIPAQNFHIALYDSDSDELSFPYFVDQDAVRPEPMKAGQSLAAYVLRTGRPLLATPQELAALVAAGEVEPQAPELAEWVGVPLCYKDHVIGVMVVQSQAGTLRFGAEETNILSFVSTQVAMAIEHRRAEEEIKRLATIDSMTGLYNRRQFFELAEQEFERSRRYAHPLSILMIDVDNLKSINDTYGHLAGDQLIQAVAKLCRKELRKIDLVGRYGGDEFVALMPETPLAKAAHGVERLRLRAAQKALHFEDQAVLVSISVGVAEIDETCLRLETLLARADQALYSAKAAGKNCVAVWKG